MRSAAAGWVLAVLLVTAAPSTAIMCYIAPRAPVGAPDGHIDGVFESVECGFDGSPCSLSFRKDGGAKAYLTLVRRPLIIDGHAVAQECGSIPWDHMHTRCPNWPQNVVPGKARIRISYWWVDQYDTCPAKSAPPMRFKPIAVTYSFATLPPANSDKPSSP